MIQHTTIAEAGRAWLPLLTASPTPSGTDTSVHSNTRRHTTSECARAQRARWPDGRQNEDEREINKHVGLQKIVFRICFANNVENILKKQFSFFAKTH
jgi:hypothetical protein